MRATDIKKCLIFFLTFNKCKIYYFRIKLFLLLLFFCFCFPPPHPSPLKKVLFKPTNFEFWHFLMKQWGGRAGQTKLQMPTIYIVEGVSFEMNKGVGVKK